MKLKNKIFITFLFLLAFILFFNINNSFASVSTDSSNAHILLNKVQDYFNNKDLILYDYLICNDGFVYAFSKEDFTHRITGTRIYCDGAYIFQFDEEYNYTFPVTEGECNFTDYGLASSIIYSSFDVFYKDGTLFFQQTPVILETLGMEIPALETAEQIPEAIMTTLKIIIPVGLILLSIGLVIYLIKRVRYLTM